MTCSNITFLVKDLDSIISIPQAFNQHKNLVLISQYRVTRHQAQPLAKDFLL